MALFTVPHIEVKGVSACVPPTVDRNRDSHLLSDEEKEKLIASIGVEEKRVADAATCASDLCFTAAERLLAELGWRRDEIEILIFVSQSPDYILPATACILQYRLGLPQECYAADLSLGCSGWGYGMSTIASVMSAGKMKKGLLLAGDTTTKLGSSKDKTYQPLFGDAGTATALSYSEGYRGLTFHTATDGSGKEAIIIPDGGYRNMVNSKSLSIENSGGGILRSRLHCHLEGMDVFSFAINKVPKSVKKVWESVGIEKEGIDYYLFHQANLMLNETIVKKLKLEPTQVPYSIRKFGNTSSATIPLTMVTELKEFLRTRHLKMIGCGFGVGLSWATVYFETENIVCPDLIEYRHE